MNAILASFKFNVLVSHLIIRRQGKTRLSYTGRIKKATKITFNIHSTPHRSQTSLEHRPKIFLRNVANLNF